MKKPEPPPVVSEIIAALPAERWPVLAAARLGPLVEGRYLHWDEVRHRDPPAGLSHREWWLMIDVARSTLRERLPLFDISGEPFTLSHTPSLRQALHFIDQRFGTAPSVGLRKELQIQGEGYVLSSSLMEEAIRSSQLEGAATTREAAKEMIRRSEPPRDRGGQMILNNFAAMNRLEEMASHPLTQADVFELHRILVEGTLDDPSEAGAFRKDDDQIVVELLHTIETAHVPPPAAELPERMERLLAFANGETPEQWIHPILRAIILHFMIGYDHPFVDGNGRTARALFYWAMIRHGYPLARYISISSILRKAPARYARAYLFTETDGGDLTYFVDHQVDVLLQSISGLEAFLARKVREIEEAERTVRDTAGLNHRQMSLLSHALRNPGFEYTVQSHLRSHRITENTARTDLTELVDRSYLLPGRRDRRHIYIAPRNLRRRLDDP